MFKYILFIFLTFFCSCSEDNLPDNKSESAQLPVKEHINPKPANPSISTTPVSKHNTPSKEDIYKANHLIGFANHAKDILSKGFHFLPDALANNTKFYLATWQLPPRPKHPPRENEAFSPPAGLFNEQEIADLEKAYRRMDAALNKLLGYYANLEKYVADRSIQDEGKRGITLANQVLASHKQFIAARHDWLEIVNKQTQAAEAILLADHPLQRQIIAAQQILNQFTEVTDILTSGTANRSLLSGCKESIENLIAIGQRPPFPSLPGIERQYRNFLKDVGQYVEALNNIITYGDHEAERHKLNFALRTCQKSYNAFAALANSQP